MFPCEPKQPFQVLVRNDISFHDRGPPRGAAAIIPRGNQDLNARGTNPEAHPGVGEINRPVVDP